MNKKLSAEQGARLLRLVRQTIGQRFGLEEKMGTAVDNDADLQQSCSTFVTLKNHGNLRGCIGNLEPSDSLLESIRRNALSAAFHDQRFSPLSAEEFSQVEVEISILSSSEPLEYRNATDLVEKLRPGIDGVILQLGKSRATFLPQVWEQLPEPVEFLNHLCEKAGLLPSAWQHDQPDIFLYQVQSFKEEQS